MCYCGLVVYLCLAAHKLQGFSSVFAPFKPCGLKKPLVHTQVLVVKPQRGKLLVAMYIYEIRQGAAHQTLIFNVFYPFTSFLEHGALHLDVHFYEFSTKSVPRCGLTAIV
jgi:hypothetical protein